MNEGSERIGGFLRDLGDAARRNPVSAALIGMGAVWLFASRSPRASELIRRSGIDRLPDAAQEVWEGTSSALRSRGQDVRDSIGETADTLRRRTGDAMDRLADRGEQFARTASDYATDLPDRASDLFDDASQSLTDLFKSQPLAIGAVGLAIGAAIASSLPKTAIEDTYFGEGSEFVKQKAAELAGEQVERATEVGMKVAEAVADEARQQGLTADGLRSAADELSKKVTRVAEAATGQVSR